MRVGSRLDSRGHAWTRHLGVVALALAGCFNEETVEPGADGTTSATGMTTSMTTMPSPTSASDPSATMTLTTSTDTLETTSADEADGSTSGDASTGSTSEPDPDSSSSDTTGTPTCVDDPAMNFVDDFERPNSDDIGNCWIEKNPAVWGLGDGEVIYEGGEPTQYFDNMVYRDVEIRDVSTSIVTRVIDTNDINEPHPMVRIQPASLVMGAEYDAYALVPHLDDGEMSLCIMRFNGLGYITEQRCDAVPSLGEGPDGYRLTLDATGENPVELVGVLEELSTGTMYTIEWSDNSTQRITAPRAVGFSGGTINAVLSNYVITEFTSRPSG